MKTQNLFLNPFQRISDTKALFLGLIGLFVVVILCILAHLHFNGLGQVAVIYDSNHWLIYLSEHLIIWFVSVILFYITGLLLSKSSIRLIDILGTMLFAQLPFIGVALISFIPSVHSIMSITQFSPEVIESLSSMKGLIGIFLFIPFFIWTIIWMFQAFKISCNLKGTRLGVSFAFVIITCDIVSRLLIALIR